MRVGIYGTGYGNDLRPGEGDVLEVLHGAVCETGDAELRAGYGGDGTDKREDIRTGTSDVGEVAPGRVQDGRAGDDRDFVERQRDRHRGALGNGLLGDDWVDDERQAGRNGLYIRSDILDLPVVLVATRSVKTYEETGDRGWN